MHTLKKVEAVVLPDVNLPDGTYSGTWVVDRVEFSHAGNNYEMKPDMTFSFRKALGNESYMGLATKPCTVTVSGSSLEVSIP